MELEAKIEGLEAKIGELEGKIGKLGEEKGFWLTMWREATDEEQKDSCMAQITANEELITANQKLITEKEKQITKRVSVGSGMPLCACALLGFTAAAANLTHTFPSPPLLLRCSRPVGLAIVSRNTHADATQ